ncbi:MAG: OmpH family outer membrane protein [Prevotellaceae bacterium]|jgi:outer membrane protein|nr:OmpH family outer membrane protein [Prevotellaceae bacterium]
MRKIFLVVATTATALLIGAGAAQAQKYAVIDSEYILHKMPKYRLAQEQVDKLAAEYQKEVDDLYKKVDDMFRTFQAEKMLLTEDMKRRREGEIVAKEKEAKELQRTYFGPDGALFKKREELLKPVQDMLFNGVKDIAAEGGYAVIFDAANNPSLIYINPRYDKSDDVLKRLGF